MSAIKLTDHVYSVGVLNPALRVFDIIMESKFGTSYNAFLIKGKKNVLVDTVHASYFDEYLRNIQEVADLSTIDTLIVNHTEPDHSGAVARLLELNPNITVYCTFAAKKCLTGIVNRDFSCVVVKEGDKLALPGTELDFIIAPLLHWPDTMFTWMPEDKVLFTCDFLGCHYCEPSMLDSTLHEVDRDKYWGEFAYYYQGIFGPFKPAVLAGLEKIKDLPIAMVCNSHGPCLTENIEKCEELYRVWSSPETGAKKSVAILYASAYSYTELLAKAAYEELSADASLDVKLVNIVTSPFGETVSLINSANAVLVGSCTINRDAPKIVWDMLASVDAINTRGRSAGAFGSYGWSGEAVPMMKSRLEHLKFKFVGCGLRVNFKPAEADLSAMKAYAREVADAAK